MNSVYDDWRESQGGVPPAPPAPQLQGPPAAAPGTHDGVTIDESSIYRDALKRMEDAMKPASAMPIPDMPQESFLDMAAPFIAAALRTRGLARQPGMGHDLANIASVGLQGYLGARAGASERRFRRYELDRAEALRTNTSNEGERRADVRAARSDVQSAASALSKYGHDERNRVRGLIDGYQADADEAEANMSRAQSQEEISMWERIRDDRRERIRRLGGGPQSTVASPNVVPRPPKVNVAGGDEFDPQKIADRIVREGVANPSGYSRGQWGAIVSKIPDDFNLDAAIQKERANKTFVATINGRQFTLLRGAEESIVKTLKPLWDANELVEQEAKFGKSAMVNKWRDLLLKNGLASDAAYDALDARTSLAVHTRDQIAQVLQAGGVPGEMALTLSNDIVNSDREAPPRRIRNQIRNALLGLGIRGKVFEEIGPHGIPKGKKLGPDVAKPASGGDWFDEHPLPPTRTGAGTDSTDWFSQHPIGGR